MSKAHKFDSLTGLKGLFSLIIVFFHTLPQTPLIDAIPLTSLIRNYGGGIGNYFFFITSGFLISFGYKERIVAKEISFGSFLVKRLQKIYPLYILSNLAALLVTMLQFGPSAINLKNIVFTVLLQNGGGLEAAYPYNGPSWFLSALFVCYMAFFFASYHGKSATHYRCMIAFGIIWGYSVLTGRFFVPLSFAHHGGSFFSFFTGCALAELYPFISQKEYKWLTPVSILVLVFSGVLLLYYGVDVISGDFNVAFAFLICPLILYLALDCKPIRLVLQIKPIMFLGKISFSIYLWHFVVYDLYRYLYRVLSGGKQIEEPQYLIYLVLTIIVSMISHKYIENRPRQTVSFKNNSL